MFSHVVLIKMIYSPLMFLISVNNYFYLMTFEKYVANIDFYVGETGINTQTLQF